MMAYPHIGYQCESSNIVKKVELAGDYWTGDSKYKLTLEDGTEYFSTYEKIGEKVCIKESAKFIWWEAKSQ